MVLQKEDIWERLKIETHYVAYAAPGDNPPTALFAAVVPERQFRHVVAIWISGNLLKTTALSIYKLDEDPHDPLVYADFTLKWSPIGVAPADFRQIPKGSYSITDPVITLEGGTNLYGKVDEAGKTLNVTIMYWDWDV